MDGAMHDDLGQQNNDISLFFLTNGVKDYNNEGHIPSLLILLHNSFTIDASKGLVSEEYRTNN
jgi:hypothetical protein